MVHLLSDRSGQGAHIFAAIFFSSHFYHLLFCTSSSASVALNRLPFPLCFLIVHSLVILPDITPAVTVDVMGDFLSLTWARKEKSSPSRAMAKMIRGRGNMDPNRLGGGGGGGKTSDWGERCRCSVKEDSKEVRRAEWKHQAEAAAGVTGC